MRLEFYLTRIYKFPTNFLRNIAALTAQKWQKSSFFVRSLSIQVWDIYNNTISFMYYCPLQANGFSSGQRQKGCTYSDCLVFKFQPICTWKKLCRILQRRQIRGRLLHQYFLPTATLSYILKRKKKKRKENVTFTGCLQTSFFYSS